MIISSHLAVQVRPPLHKYEMTTYHSARVIDCIMHESNMGDQDAHAINIGEPPWRVYIHS